VISSLPSMRYVTKVARERRRDRGDDRRQHTNRKSMPTAQRYGGNDSAALQRPESVAG